MQTPTSTLVETLIPTPGPTSPPTPADSGLRVVTVELAGGRFSTEIADTGATRAQGLSDREALAPEAAMLFVYESPRPVAFWMRRMRFPLDMVWIGADLTVVGVTANVPPPAAGTPDANLPTYSSGTPPQYVLEINAGLAEAYRIVPGERMRIVPG